MLYLRPVDAKPRLPDGDQNTMPIRIICLLGLLLLNTAAEAGDDRSQFGLESPPWLVAVGRLQVPGLRSEAGNTRHHTENCSATLIGDRVKRQPDTIVTAWHCLEFYRDLSKPILFSLPAASGSWQTRAYPLAQGGDMRGDWALLRLIDPVKPDLASPLAVNSELPRAGEVVLMAGYSRDDGTGAGGHKLSYDEFCRVTTVDQWAVNTDCLAFKGASGGAVVRRDPEGLPQLTGIISQGDGVGTSTFIPLARFRSELRLHLGQ